MSGAISIREAIDDYMAVYATQIKASTVVLQRIYMRHFLDWITNALVFDLRAVTRQHIEQYHVHLSTVEYRWRDGMKRIAANTRADRFSSVRRFFAWTVRTRLLLVDPSLTIKQAPRKRWQPDNVLTEAETVMVLESPDLDTPKGLRDRAILELIYSTGLRCAEVSALDLTDVDLTECVVFVRCGKGSKQRIVPIGESAVEAVRQYLTHARSLFLKHPGVRALFIASWRCGDMGRRLGRVSIRITVQRAARKAGIMRRVTTHTLRHSVATHMLRAGADLRYVQELLGHNRIDTTECYTHLAVRDIGDAHAKAHPRGTTKRVQPWELPPAPVPPWQPSEVLSDAEVAVLRDAAPCDTPIDTRNRAILELLHSSGLRRSEIVALDLTDVDLTSGTALVRKRAKPRVVPIGESAIVALTLYLNVARPVFVTQATSAALFVNSNHGGPGTIGGRLHPRMVTRIVRGQGHKAGITRNVTPSMFRRSLDNAAAMCRGCPQSN